MPDSPLYEVEDTEPMEPITEADILRWELERATSKNRRMVQLIQAIALKNYSQIKHIFLRNGGNERWYRHHDTEDRVAIAAQTMLQWLEGQE